MIDPHPLGMVTAALEDHLTAHVVDVRGDVRDLDRRVRDVEGDVRDVERRLP